VNERGEIVKALPQFTRGVLDIDAVPRQGATLYVRWRDAPVLILLGVILLGAAVIKIKGTVRK
jgi:apolipoprotein N-acyltransferase